jgi:hypothetical protein
MKENGYFSSIFLFLPSAIYNSFRSFFYPVPKLFQFWISEIYFSGMLL